MKMPFRRNRHFLHRASLPTALTSVALTVATLAVATLGVVPTAVAKEARNGKPTVLLVHGAFAESSSWDGVATRLFAKDYAVTAVAIPLRSVRTDASYLARLIDAVDGPVVLVGHSYGGEVIGAAAFGKPNVKALVYVGGFAPAPGESAATLGAKFPGGTLGSTLAPPVVLDDGSKDLYIAQDKYHAQFAADVPAPEARLMAATQRPITEAALNEPSTNAAWQTIPSWFIYGSLDKNIPRAVHAFMAKRARARQDVEVQGASHAVLVSHPDAVAKMIEDAADATK